MAKTNGTKAKGTTIAVWILSALVGLAFLGSGGAKLAGAPAMVTVFETIGYGQWFRYVTGLLEVAGAIALFLPAWRFYGAALLAVIMVFAVGFHLAVLGGSPAPAFVLLLLSGAIAWLSRPVAA